MVFKHLWEGPGISIHPEIPPSQSSLSSFAQQVPFLPPSLHSAPELGRSSSVLGLGAEAPIGQCGIFQGPVAIVISSPPCMASFAPALPRRPRHAGTGCWGGETGRRKRGRAQQGGDWSKHLPAGRRIYPRLGIELTQTLHGTAI